MEYSIETLNVEMFSLLRDYRKLKSNLIKNPSEETEKDLSEVSIKIEGLQYALSVLNKIEV